MRKTYAEDDPQVTAWEMEGLMAVLFSEAANADGSRIERETLSKCEDDDPELILELNRSEYLTYN